MNALQYLEHEIVKEQNIVVKKFLHDVVDMLMDIPRSFLKYYISQETQSITSIEKLSTLYGDWFMKNIGKDILNRNELNTVLQQFEMPSKYLESIAEVYMGRISDIQYAIKKQILTVSRAHLTDFDCSTRLVLGSSKLSNMRVPKVLLKLSIKDSMMNVKDTILEMNEQELDEILKKFETINEVLNKVQN